MGASKNLFNTINVNVKRVYAFKKLELRTVLINGNYFAIETISTTIPTAEQKPDNIILNTGTNNLKTIDTPEEITIRILNLAMQNGYKQRFCIWYCPKMWQA